MGMPLDVSDFLANLHGDDTKPDEDPDWLKELDDGDGSKEVWSLNTYHCSFAVEQGAHIHFSGCSNVKQCDVTGI